METVIVFISVKPEKVDDFIKCTVENVKNSKKEPGVINFEFMQNTGESSKFILMEEYKDKQASIQHKETRHYRLWRDEVVEMMAVPRQGIWYKKISVIE
jgi:autoinducer 2-degrading protein